MKLIFFQFSGADPDITDADGLSPLAWACLRSRIPTVSVLLNKGADLGKLTRDMMSK